MTRCAPAWTAAPGRPASSISCFRNRTYTFGEIDDAVNRFANGLLAQGLVAAIA